MDNELIKSFNPQETLNPKIWEKDGDEPKLKPEIREGLLNIANEFIEFLDVDIIVTDIILTGSLSNFNWSKYSDFDLHIVADFSQYSEKQKELYEKLFNLKPSIFKSKTLTNLYHRNIIFIEKKIISLHEDLQYDYQLELENFRK